MIEPPKIIVANIDPEVVAVPVATLIIPEALLPDIVADDPVPAPLATNMEGVPVTIGF